MASTLINLSDACTPRKSVFDKSRKDVVLHLGDLLTGKMKEKDAELFFEENFVTKGMKSLIEKTFQRLSGKKDQAATFLLSQAMGGGKTHSMLALGLLAKYPSIRKKLWRESELGSEDIKVIGFDGRESDYPFGIWGALAEQLGKKDAFNSLYSPLQAPGVTSWIKLLQGEPTVILLDELPPYFASALSKSVGDSNLAAVTTTAVSNLMVAANKEELNNVVIVISDLSATAYSNLGTGVMAALENLEKETNRSALVIEPVATQGDEVFHILRTRLFEKLPAEKVRTEVANAYAEAVKKAKQMELTAATPESFAAEISDSYPFHFALRDLYGRFKENPNFQQTRGLLRMMRAIIANIWTTGKAKKLHLVHPYDIDLNDGDIFTEFDRINSSLSEAVRTDIANNGHSHAEERDAELKTTDATDAAKLVYVSSLSTAQKAIIGLRDTEIIAWLCAPGRSIERVLSDVLEVLPNRAWYLHLSLDGRLYFKNIQNLAARLFGMVNTATKENKIQELRKYLLSLFEPKLKDLYQEIKVLAPIDDIVISQDKTTLVVTDPWPDAKSDQPLNPEWVKFHSDQTFQNRLLFLTGDRNTMDEVLKNAAYLKAVEVVIAEQDQEGVSPKDPQAVEARRSRDKYQVQLRSAVQQTFSTIVYPHRGKLRHEHINFNFDNNQYDAEAQIRRTLQDNQKFSVDKPNDTWIKKAEERLFDNQNPVPWNDVKKRAAVKPEWQFHHPSLLEDIREYAVAVGRWRAEGNMIRRGPFEKEPTRVTVTTKSYDQDTGEAVLQITPEGGNKVYYEIGEAKPTASSLVINDFSGFHTRELKLSFLCVDEGPDPRPTGIHYVWKNVIQLRARIYQQGKDFYAQIVSNPEVPVRYTTDGRDPAEHGVPYAGDILLPPDCRMVLAVGEKDGVSSKVESFRVERKAGAEIDKEKPAVWFCGRHYQNRPASEAFQVLERTREVNAALSNVLINCVSSATNEVIYYTLPKGEIRPAGELADLYIKLRELITDAHLTLSISEIHFKRGQDLLDWMQKDRLSIDVLKEVKQ
ncbi:MAG: ATP-binding protein [Spirochaetales bacterium]|nr:ATP-binding protein [Spirochaetales bacterium]